MVNKRGKSIERVKKKDNISVKKSILEEIAPTASVIGFGAGMFYIGAGSSKNLQFSPGVSTNWNLILGIGFILVAIAAGYFVFKKYKK